MNKRIFIIHGWDGYPEEGWFPWLEKELEEKGFKVFVPQLPDAESPRIQKWVQKIAETVGPVDENTYLVGHSMGCQAIARYLESLPAGVKVGGAVFVAGFFKRLTNLEDEEDVRETAKHWLEAPLDLAKAKTHLPKSVAIFSDNDQYVSADNQDDFRDKLGSEIVIEKHKGHFTGPGEGGDGITELPVVLESILNMTS
ncbi:MAG: alpha/beta fold hydrolase [Patescibacteria group bacterium]|nr:alpha/beta fold hydrolase [Patescibacteria group bacterium]MDD5490793.1 alpha/beta fold hydrolase [Patescibacteria group bacterium]